MLINGKHKLIIIISVIVISAIISLVYFKSRKPVSDKPPVQLQAETPIKQTEQNINTPNPTIQDIPTNIPNHDVQNQPVGDTVPVPSSIQPTGPKLSPAEYYTEGIKYKSQRQLPQAVTSFGEAIKADPKQPMFYTEKAEAEHILGKNMDAIATLQDGLIKNPDNQQLSNQLLIYQSIR